MLVVSLLLLWLLSKAIATQKVAKMKFHLAEFLQDLLQRKIQPQKLSTKVLLDPLEEDLNNHSFEQLHMIEAQPTPLQVPLQHAESLVLLTLINPSQ